MTETAPTPPPSGPGSPGCLAIVLVVVGGLFAAVSGSCVGGAALHELGRMIGGHGNLEEFVIVTIMAVVTIGIGIGVVWLGIKLMNR
jgi:putative exporter of polyketide antibiotics